MKTALPREHRRILESTVAQARTQAEDGAAKALKALAVGAKEPQTHATPDQKKLRVQLRAHGRALGDAASSDGMQGTAHLVTEIAYEHWHRMLFARFLAESNLLMHPDGYPVSLADCKEDAATIKPPARSEWEVAGRYASANHRVIHRNIAREAQRGDGAVQRADRAGSRPDHRPGHTRADFQGSGRSGGISWP